MPIKPFSYGSKNTTKPVQTSTSGGIKPFDYGVSSSKTPAISTTQPVIKPQVTAPTSVFQSTKDEIMPVLNPENIKPKTSVWDKYKKFTNDMADVVAVPTTRILSDVGSSLISITGDTIASMGFVNKKLNNLTKNPVSDWVYKTIGINKDELDTKGNDFIQNVGENIKKYGDKSSESFFDLTGTSRNYIDDVAGAIGSSMPYLIGGLGMKAIGGTETAINATMSTLEALVNGYDDYKEVKKSGDDEKTSTLKATGSFIANLGVNWITNKLGWIGKLDDKSGTVTKAIKNYFLSTGLESSQEVWQQAVSNVTQGKPVFSDLVDTFLISLPSSALFGVAGVQNNVANIANEKRKEKRLTEMMNSLADSGVTKPEIEGVLSTSFGINSEEAKAQVENITSKNTDLNTKLEENKINSNPIGKLVNNIQPTEAPEIDHEAIIQEALQDNELDSTLADMKSKQALNEAGSTLEETKTPEAVTEQPKLKISKEEPLITEAKKFKTVEEFLKSKGEPLFHATRDTKMKEFDTNYDYETHNDRTDVGQIRDYETPYGRVFLTNNLSEAKAYGENVLDTYFKGKPRITTVKTGNMSPSQYFDEEYNWGNLMEVLDDAEVLKLVDNKGKATYVVSPENLLTKSQLEEIYNKAQGEAKMKIKGETKKVTDQIDEHIKEKIGNVVKLAYDYKNKKGSPDLEAIQMAEDLEKLAKKSGPLSSEDRANFNELVKRINQEDYLPSNALDTLTTKEDNKIYETKYNKSNTKSVEGEIQPNRGANDESSSKANNDSMEEKQGRKDTNIGGNDRNQDNTSNRSLPQGSDLRTIRELVSEILPEVKTKTIDKIVSYYSRLDKEGYKLRIRRETTTKFDASMQPFTGNLFELSISNIGIENLSPETIDHEIATHTYYLIITNKLREFLFNGIKEEYNINPEKFSRFSNWHQQQYWGLMIESLKFHIENVNKGTNIDVNEILKQADIINKNNEPIFPEDIMETAFNFTPISEKLNQVLEENGYRTTDKTNEYNNLMAEEIVAFVAETSENFKDSTVPVVNKYTNDIINDTLEFKKPEVNIKLEMRDLPGFKLKEQIDTNAIDKSLISLHNISIPSLSFAQRLGGVLINPSMAVIDINKQGFDNYGEISLIGDTNLLSQGKTFASDIYSPRFPSLTIKIPKQGYDILNETYKKYEDVVDEKLYNIDTEEFDRSMSNSSLAMYDFLTKEGIKVPKTKQSGASHYDIKNGMRDIIQEKNLTSEFNTYIDRMKTNIGATSHIFKGYTYSGTRRYVPATVENISKDMKARGLANKEGMDYGLGSFRAKVVQKLATIKKISESKNRIVTTEEFEKIREEMNTQYSNLIEEYAKKLKPGTGSSNPFINFDEVSQGLSDYITGEFPEFLDRFTNVPQSLKDKTQEFIKEVKEMPTEYFESKFTRPVKLNEFKYAVIPDSTSEEIIRNLKNDGLEVIKYKKGDETDRLNKIKALKQNEVPTDSPVFFKIKLPEVNTGNRAEDAKQILAHVEQKLGVTSIVNSIKEKETAVEIAKEVLNESPASQLEKYVADAGAYKGTLPEVTGKSIAELKKNPDYRGIRNEKALEFAKNGDSIAKEIFADYGIEIDSEEARSQFEEHLDTKKRILEQEKEIKQQKQLFKNTDTFELLDKDKTILSEIVYTKNSAPEIRELIEQVRAEKAIRRKEVLEHKARPLMKYVSKKTGKLSKNFTEKSLQILEDLKFKDVDEANKAIEDYRTKMTEFVNPISRLAMDERNAKFLRDKVKIMEAVEKKMKEEGRDRKQKIEAIRDFFYMTDSEIKGVIGDKDYRLMSDKEFNDFTKKLQEESIKIAEHQMAVAEVEWTIAQKQLQKTDNFLEAMKLPKDIDKLTTEQLGKLNELFNMFENEDIFLGKREIETLTKNTTYTDIKTYRQIIAEIFPGVPLETLKAMKIDWTNYVESASSLSQDNPLLNWLIMEFRRVSIIKNQSILEVRNKINELAKAARQSRKRTWLQKLIPTDELVWDYINESDLEMKTAIAKTMTKSELEYAHYMANGPVGWDKKRDYLLEKGVLENYFKDETYITHLRRGFLEAWLRSDSKNNFFSAIPKFFMAIRETIFEQHKLEEKTLNILNERTASILPLEKYFPYKERRSGTLVPSKNMARVFLQYHVTFETKRMLDTFMPPAVSLAHAVSPSERTEAGIEMDTSIMKFVKEFINTQKGRPMSFSEILKPGNSLDVAIRTGITFVRFKFLAYNLVSQLTTPIGEQYATYIESGLRKYALGVRRSKLSKQGNLIAKKYEAIIGEPLFDKLKNEAIDIGSKVGETAFAGFSIASRQANKVYLLGQLTREEFMSGEISDKRLAEIENNMYKWRAGDPVSGIASKTSIGAATRQFRSWAIPIAAQSYKNVKKMVEITKKDGFKSAATSKEFGELFRATVPVLIFMLLMYRMYKELGDKEDKSFSEKIIYKAMNEISSTLQSLAPATFLSLAPLQSVLLNLMTSLGQITVGLATGDRTAEGGVPGVPLLKKTVVPSFFKSTLEPSKEEEAYIKISKSSYKAKGELEDINKDLVNQAKDTWEKVKELGEGSKEAKALIDETYPRTKEGNNNYKIYEKAKQADMKYWKGITEKVIPIVEQASVYGFNSKETKELTNRKNMTDDEFTVYEKIKDVLYPTTSEGEQDEWDKQSFIQHVSNLYKGWNPVTGDPVDALNKLIRGGDWKITEITNGQIIVNRMPESATEAMKKEVGKQGDNWRADHIWPVHGGGGSDKNNINIISTSEWRANTPVEVYLIKQLKAGNITGDQLKEYATRFKIGRGQVTSGPLFEKYKTPITFEEIKQEIAK